MFLLQSADALRTLLRDQPSLWLPDNLLLLQEYFPVDVAQGIVRMEFLGNKLLYAMRVVSNGAFNLCPSEACNPEGGSESSCLISVRASAKPVEFRPYAGVPAAAVRMGEKIMASAGLDVGGIEYLEIADGRQIFYDVNANSNLRAPIGQAFGFDPFERVVDYLTAQIERTGREREDLPPGRCGAAKIVELPPATPAANSGAGASIRAPSPRGVRVSVSAS
jgi:hypothetical protein